MKEELLRGAKTVEYAQELQLRVSELELHRRTQEMERDTQQKRVAELEKELRTTTQELSQLQASFTAAQMDKARLEGENGRLQGRLDEDAKEMKELRKALVVARFGTAAQPPTQAAAPTPPAPTSTPTPTPAPAPATSASTDASLARLQGEVSRLRGERESMQSELRELQQSHSEQIQQLRVELTKRQEACKESLVAIKKLMQRVKDRNREIETLKEERQQWMQQQMEVMEKKIEQAKIQAAANAANAAAAMGLNAHRTAGALSPAGKKPRRQRKRPATATTTDATSQPESELIAAATTTAQDELNILVAQQEAQEQVQAATASPQAAATPIKRKGRQAKKAQHQQPTEHPINLSSEQKDAVDEAGQGVAKRAKLMPELSLPVQPTPSSQPMSVNWQEELFGDSSSVHALPEEEVPAPASVPPPVPPQPIVSMLPPPLPPTPHSELVEKVAQEWVSNMNKVTPDTPLHHHPLRLIIPALCRALRKRMEAADLLPSSVPLPSSSDSLSTSDSSASSVPSSAASSTNPSSVHICAVDLPLFLYHLLHAVSRLLLSSAPMSADGSDGEFICLSSDQSKALAKASIQMHDITKQLQRVLMLDEDSSDGIGTESKRNGEESSEWRCRCNDFIGLQQSAQRAISRDLGDAPDAPAEDNAPSPVGTADLGAASASGSATSNTSQFCPPITPSPHGESTLAAAMYRLHMQQLLSRAAAGEDCVSLSFLLNHQPDSLRHILALLFSHRIRAPFHLLEHALLTAPSGVLQQLRTSAPLLSCPQDHQRLFLHPMLCALFSPSFTLPFCTSCLSQLDLFPHIVRGLIRHLLHATPEDVLAAHIPATLSWLNMSGAQADADLSQLFALLMQQLLIWPDHGGCATRSRTHWSSSRLDSIQLLLAALGPTQSIHLLHRLFVPAYQQAVEAKQKRQATVWRKAIGIAVSMTALPSTPARPNQRSNGEQRKVQSSTDAQNQVLAAVS